MSHYVRSPLIPGQGPRLVLGVRNSQRDVRYDTSAFSALTRPPVPRTTPIIPGGEHAFRRPEEIAKGLGLGQDQERDVAQAAKEWMAAPNVVAFRESLIQSLRTMAPTDHALRGELTRRALQVWKATRPGAPSRSDVIQKAEQLELFGKKPEPKPAPKLEAKKPEPKPKKQIKGTKPVVGDWQPIPGGKHGGQRRRRGNRWEYRYPDGKGGWSASPPKLVAKRKKKTVVEKPAPKPAPEPEKKPIVEAPDEPVVVREGTPAEPGEPIPPQRAPDVPEKPEQPAPKPKPKAKKKATEEPTTERYSDEEAIDRLRMIGDQLYEAQYANMKEFDGIGLSRNDMGTWRLGVSGVDNLRRVLAKYKRQIGERWDADEWHKLGLGDYMAKKADLSVTPKYHPQWGQLELPVKGFISRKNWPKYLDAMRYLKAEVGAKYEGSPPWFVPREKVELITPEIWATFQDKMSQIGVVVGSVPPMPEKKKKAEADDVVAQPTADEVIAGIQNRRAIPGMAAVKRHADGSFHIYTPYADEFLELFSNKGGGLSGITEWRPETKSRKTLDLDLVEEAIDKIQSVLPAFTVVTDGVKEARQEQDAREAELKKPIPEVAKQLAPEFKLFPYQNEAVRFLQEKDGKALVGDEMGLGKTLQSLAYGAAEGKRMLVVVPKVVRRTWIQEAEKFFPDYFKGKSRELISSDLRKPKSKGGGQPDLSGVNIATVNYESLQKFLPAIKAAGFDTIVVDESHRMKSPKAKITKTISSLRDHFPHRILLSGTAVKNKKDELHTQAQFVEPGLFSRSELKYGTIGGTWNKLKQSIYMARQKRDVLPDLPEKTTLIAEQPVPNMPAFPTDIGEMSAARIEAAMAKAPVTTSFVKEMLDTSDSSVLVFTESKEAAEKMAADLGAAAILHHGQMSDNKREAAKAEFQREGTKKRVFVSTRQSLAVGATLTAADKVVFNDIPWTAADLRQAEDRAHRVGQKNNVNVYWMTAQDSSWDKTATQILLRKYELNRKINEGRQLTEEERKWMSQPVKLDEIKKELAGIPVGPKTAELDKALGDWDDEDPVEKSVDDYLARMRPRLMLRQTSNPMELVWMAEELPDEIHADQQRHPPGWPQSDGLEKAGPYIGPRGGKWADPQHTIPWKDSGTRDKSGENSLKYRKYLYFHSTTEELYDLYDSPLSVTDDSDASSEYLRGRDGFQYLIAIPAGLNLASEKDIEALADAMHPDHPYSHAWEMVEQLSGVSDELKRRGYDGIEIADVTPDNNSEHQTITVFDAAVSGIKVVRGREVSGDGEIGDPIPQEDIDDIGKSLKKGAAHRYLKRLPTGKPKPKWRYIYKHPKRKGLTASEDLKAGAKFKVEHAGKLGHFEVQAHDAHNGVVTLKHDESGRVAHIRERDLHRMIASHHSKKTEDAIKPKPEPLKLRREEQQQRLPGTEAKARKPKKEGGEPRAESLEAPKGPAPKLPRATMADLGKGGYDNIEGFSANAADLETQAAAAKDGREYAVIPQTGGFVLASREPAPKGKVKEAKGDKTELILRGSGGEALQKVETEYVVVEAADLIASHDPESFSKRSEYPEGVQERRYEVQGSGDQGKIDRIAREMEPSLVVNTTPDAINGTPMVTQDGIVLGGNGRTMGMQRAYKLYPEKAEQMKQHLQRHARVFGVSAAEVGAMQQPILVRRMKVDTDDQRALGRRMNEALTQGMDPRTIEVALGQNYVTPELLDSLTHNMDADQSLSEFLRSTRSRPFVRALERAGVIDQYNKDEFVEKGTGTLNEDGRMRVERVLTARMIPDAGVLSRMGTKLRQTIARSVPSLIAMERHGWNVQPALELAVRADNDMKLEGFSGGKRFSQSKGKKISIPPEEHRREYLKQTSMLSGDLQSKVRNDPMAQLMLEAVQDQANKLMPSKWRQVALEADRQNTPTLGGVIDKRSPEQVISEVFGLQGPAKPKAKAPEQQAQPEMFAMSLPVSDLAKAKPAEPTISGEDLSRYLMHAVLWQLDNLMRAAVGEGDKPSGAQILARLKAFIVDQTKEDQQFARALGAHPLSDAVLRGLIRAAAQARVTDLAKSLATRRLEATRRVIDAGECCA